MAGGWHHDESRRARVAGALAMLLALIALTGSTRAALHRPPRDPGDAAAGVIPDVVYAEQEHAALATIAHVDPAIAEEVTRDEAVLSASVASASERARATTASGGTPSGPTVPDTPRAAERTDDKPSDASNPDNANKDAKPVAESTTTTVPPTDTSEPSNPGRQRQPRSSEPTTTTTTTTTEPAPSETTTTTTEPKKPKGNKG